MKTPGELEREVEKLRSRVSKLSSACLRISASLDGSTVLREIVDAARDLTGAALGAIVTVSESCQPAEFVTSGFTPDEHRLMVSWSDGPRLFEHFRSLPDPIRRPDMAGYFQSLGLSLDLTRPKSFQGTPMRHRGVYVGSFFLGDKEGGEEFTREDEEVLLLFASQAATAVANARRYRAEQRARADLEALVNTSPVGVVVFDARTGRPAYFNEEARRIVEHLCTPGRSPEELLDYLTFRRADGREHALAELPLIELLRTATSVRAEELVIQVPDGRSVTVLVNATPIRSEEGEVESVVVTIQDLSPVEGMERLRAEFLGMVSHELRVPLTSIKGSAATVLGAPSTLEPVEMLQFFRIIEQQADHMAGLVSDLLDVGRIESGTLSVSPEPVEVASLVDQARNTFLSGGGRHAVEIDLPLDLPWILADRRRIVQVLNNLISNAATHSPETSPIRISARRAGIFMEISVTDQGRGVPAEHLPRLFRKYPRSYGDDGPRTAPRAGLGLAICKGLVETHGGRVWAESGGAGQGTRISLTVPLAEANAARLTRLPTPLQPSLPEARPILVVDDDPETLRYVRNALTAAGYSGLVTGNPEEVPSLIKKRKPVLVLLDLLLPGIDGIEMMESIPGLADLPVIFISAYGRDETIAKALQKGAVDYIVKPFSPTELVARIEAALRGRDTQPEPFRLGDLRINYAERKVTLCGRSVELTATEFDLLRELSLKAGRVLTYDSLLQTLWGRKDSADPRSVRSFVKKLRRKLGDSATKPLISEHRSF
ncbi:MAG: response regulator [Bryobacterales bacterium]|nr:response regulator [Bryobacterales bacterium]